MINTQFELKIPNGAHDEGTNQIQFLPQSGGEGRDIIKNWPGLNINPCLKVSLIQKMLNAKLLYKKP